MKDFLREQLFVGSNVDLIAALGKICVSMCRKIQKKITYIDLQSSKDLQEAIGITYTVDSEYRSFIDWSETAELPRYIDLLSFRQVLRTMNEVVQGPCLGNQASFIQLSNVIEELIDLLKFIGAYFYIGTINASNFQGNIVEDMRQILGVAIAADLKVEAEDIKSSLEAMTKTSMKGEAVAKGQRGGLDPMRFHKRNRDLKSSPLLQREKRMYIYIYIYIGIKMYYFKSR